ncbi:MAG: hypothetical protein WAL51_06795, partial [Candidatus Acidiferrales bacterium]
MSSWPDIERHSSSKTESGVVLRADSLRCVEKGFSGEIDANQHECKKAVAREHNRVHQCRAERVTEEAARNAGVHSGGCAGRAGRAEVEHAGFFSRD